MTTNGDPPRRAFFVAVEDDKFFRSLVTSSLHGGLNHAGATVRRIERRQSHTRPNDTRSLRRQDFDQTVNSCQNAVHPARNATEGSFVQGK